jgi:acyl-CoA dehydrogenase
VSPDILPRITAVAEVASRHADEVDVASRFPREALAEASRQRLLSSYAPLVSGGEGASLEQIANACSGIAQGCAAAGMVFAMHQIQLATLVRHGHASVWATDFLRRVVADQLLIASSTTEDQTGGDMSRSACAVDAQGSTFTLHKSATVVSYGLEADALFVTARRKPDATPNDQVLVCLERRNYHLKPGAEWNALGMRGTCSGGYDLTATAATEQVLPESYGVIQASTVLPVAHILWGSVWIGIAAAAVEKARRFSRNQIRSGSDVNLPGSLQLAQITSLLTSAKANILCAARDFDRSQEQGEAPSAWDFGSQANSLKINISEYCLSAVLGALQVCGLAGYRADGDFSIARHLRDICSAPLMINNNRLQAIVARTALMNEVTPWLAP